MPAVWPVAMTHELPVQQSPVLDVPKWTVYLAIPVGAALETLLMILTWNHDNSAADELTDRTL